MARRFPALLAALLLAPWTLADVGLFADLQIRDDGTARLRYSDCTDGHWYEVSWEPVGERMIHAFTPQPAPALGEGDPGPTLEYEGLWLVRGDGALQQLPQVWPEEESYLEAERVPRPWLATAVVSYQEAPLPGAEVTFHCRRGDVVTTTDRFGEAHADDCHARAVEVSRHGFLPVSYEVEEEESNLFTAELAVDRDAPDLELFLAVADHLYVDVEAFGELLDVDHETFEEVLDVGVVDSSSRVNGREIVVEVLDQDLAPIAGADVTVLCETGSAAATSDSEGVARLPHCALRGFEVAADGHRTVRHGVWAGTDANDFEVRLVAEAVTGQER